MADELEKALEADREKLIALGGDPGPTEEEFFGDWDRDADAGCAHCDGSGWKHGCPDDLCRGSNEPEDCDMARRCTYCNTTGV